VVWLGQASVGVVSLALLLVGSEPLAAQTASMPTGPAAIGPAAFYTFCQRSPRHCARVGPLMRTLPLDHARWEELRAVNGAVNSAIAERSDAEIFGREDVWALPIKGQGDCEDLVLLKRQRLIEHGWPSSVLLITVVATPSGEGHTVLTVVTDRGDYVLDSRTSAIRLWSATGYDFYTRQAQGNPRRWVWVETGPRTTAADRAKQPHRTAMKRR
jgi:predicted transglutaminase-like cysteine proteinase